MKRRGIKLLDDMEADYQARHQEYPVDYERQVDQGEWVPVKLDWTIIWMYALMGLLVACGVAIVWEILL